MGTALGRAQARGIERRKIVILEHENKTDMREDGRGVDTETSGPYGQAWETYRQSGWAGHRRC